MGIIKKDRLEDKGTIFLEEGSLEIASGQREEFTDMAAQEIEVTPEELPLLGPVQEKAARIVQNAQRRAEGIIAGAHDEIEAMKEETKVLGYEEGKKQAIEDMSTQFVDSMDTLNQAVAARRKIIKDAESEILRLSLKVAEQILRSEISLHRDVTLNIVSEAIGRVSDREQVIIRVNHEDLEYIKRYKDRIAGIVDGVKSLSIIEDSHVEAGGCVVETNLGYVDARISTKLKAIEESFRKVQESAEQD